MADTVQTIVTQRLGFPAGVLTVLTVPELPRRANGKLDHPAVTRLADRSPSLLRRATRAVTAGVRRDRSRRPTIRAVLARAFPGQELPDDASFVTSVATR